MDHFDIAVVGAGLAGSLAALALADQGYAVALIGPPAAHADGRTTALMDQSVALVKDLSLWPELAPIAAALSTMRIIDGTTRLLRAPTVTFHAAEIDLEAFGYNIPNAPFLALIEKHAQSKPRLTRFFSSLTGIATDEDKATILLEDTTSLSAGLVVGADGRRSGVRKAAGVEASTWSYPQTAVVVNFAHTLEHSNVSTELHTEDGPFTQVPLPGRRSSLVWVRKPEAAMATLALSPAELSLAIERRMQSMLGQVTVDGAAQSFPLSGMTAHRFGRDRMVFIGEAAHAFPPIGAQGLNLSLRDIRTLVALLGRADTAPLSADVGERYDRRRRADILSRTVSVDLLNRSLLSDFLPVQVLRAAGLQLLSTAGPLRNIAMREGLHPGSVLRMLRDGLREKVGRKQA